MKKNEIESYVTGLVMPILDEGGYELWDTEYVKEGQDYYVRVYADKPGGFTIEDCEKISRSLNVKLDEEDKIPGAYILEVSSPGLTRPLKRDRDFEKSIGRLVEFKLFKAVDGEKEFTGILKGNEADKITVELSDNKEMTVNKNEISMIRLAYVEE